MLNFNNQPGTLSAEKSGGAIQRSASFFKRLLLVTLFCALSFMLSAPSLVLAEDLQEGTPTEQPGTKVQPVNTADPAGLIASAVPENQAPAKANTQTGDGLELGSEIVGEAVARGTIPAPTIDKVFYDATTISGANVQRKRVGGKVVRSTVYVTLKDKNGVVKADLSVTPRSGTSWTVNLTGGITVAEGDTVTAYQTLDDATSDVVTANAEPSMASGNKDKIKMPSGEIWIEHPDANLVNKDEQAEAIDMLKKANPDIAKDFKSVKFSIDYTDHAYYEVTYSDGSPSGKIEATDLKIKQVTETSAAPTIEKVQVTDGQIIVTLDKEVAPGTKFYFVKNFTDGEEENFKEDGSCKVDKSNSQEMSQAVSVDGKKVTFQINNDDIELKKEFGILVKEPHKFRSCAKSEPVIATPDKVAVRDPHKLTDADKKAIDKAIRDANTVNGTSKLPDGTGYITDPAFIEFDKDGNVTIISPNDVETDWDSSGNPIYVKNPDGTYKLQSGKENNVIKFPAKDLVKNIAPKSPGIAVDTDKGEVTITPPAYKDPGDDTDLISYTVSYNDDKGKNQSVTVTIDLKTNKWSGTGVDENTGVITLKVEDIEVGGTIKAIAKDNGGLEGDKKKLDSEEKTQTLETATVSYNANKGTGEMKGKTVNKGTEYEILPNAFTAPANQKFKGWMIGTAEHKAGEKIRVKENTTIKAIWQDIEVTVSYKANGGSGSMDSATMKKGSKYTLLESTFNAPDDTQEFKAWDVDGQEKAPGTEITVDKDTEVKALWKKIKVNVTYDGNGGGGSMTAATVDKGSEYTVLPNGFTAPDDTQEFDTWEVNGQRVAPGTVIKPDKDTVIKATWKKITKYKVTFDGNGGTGKMGEETVKKGDSFKLPASKFEAPKNKEFKGWKIGEKEYQVGDEITVEGNTTVTAIWKDIEYKVTFDGNGGTGKMGEETVKKGDSFKLPANGFAPPAGKEFNGWQIDGKTYKVGDSITVNGDVTVKALWKDKPVPPSTTPGKDKPGKQGKLQPQNPAAGGNLSKTGANGMYSLYGSLLLLATGGLFVISRRRRAQR